MELSGLAKLVELGGWWSWRGMWGLVGLLIIRGSWFVVRGSWFVDGQALGPRTKPIQYSKITVLFFFGQFLKTNLSSVSGSGLLSIMA